MRVPAAILVAASILVPCARAPAAENDVQLWPVVALNHRLDDRWAGHFQSRLRFDDDVSQTKDLLLRGFVSWQALESLSLALGYDYLHSFQSRSEHRPWQSVQHRLRLDDLTLSNRVRLDERFVEDVSGVVLRFRYRLRGTHPIGSSAWYGVISDEVFVNLNDRGAGPVSGFEQNRLRFAAGVRFLDWLRAESGYEWQYAERRSGTSENRHVFFFELSIDTGH